MGLYYGRKQVFLNKFGTKAIREIYLGSRMVMGFVNASYSSDEIVGEKINNGPLPEITGTGSVISISTSDYTSGYGYSKYYCDNVEFAFMYGGNFHFFDNNGNVVVSIETTDSFSFSSGKWTFKTKCVVKGKTLFDTSVSGSEVKNEWISYKVYYDLSQKKWVVIWNNTTYASNTTDWVPTYFRAMPRMWSIISAYASSFFDGVVQITKMNKAKGYPNAK